MQFMGSRYFERAVAGGLRYAATVVVLLFAVGIWTGLLQGSAALGYAFVVLIWLGGIGLLAGFPIAAVFLILLYGVAPRFLTPTAKLAVLLSTAVWALAGIGLFLFAVSTNRLAPDAHTPIELLQEDLVLGVLGFVLGLVEAVFGGFRRRS